MCAIREASRRRQCQVAERVKSHEDREWSLALIMSSGALQRVVWYHDWGRSFVAWFGGNQLVRMLTDTMCQVLL